MRDAIKSETYFTERYNSDTKYLDKWISTYQEAVHHPEKYNINSYKYSTFIYAFYKFYSGYSLGLDINELVPEIQLILRNLIDTRKEHDSNYEDMEIILYFLILFNRTEYFDEYKQLLDTSEHRDFYLDSLMQHVDPLWQMSTEKILWQKEMKPLCEVVRLSKTDKSAAVKRLKKHLEKEWFKTLNEGLITNRNLERGRYRGYWCLEAAALVKALQLDDTELKVCKYYPYDMAHFC